MSSEWMAALYEMLHGAQGPDFVDHIYPQSVMALFFISFTAVAVYYYALGGFSAKYNTAGHWLAALASNSILCMAATAMICRLALGVWGMSPAITLVLVQGLYSAILFSLLSAAIKCKSPNARRTPW